MGRWFLLFALPILICAFFFEANLVIAEDFEVNFLSVGHPYGAPFVVGVGWTPTPTGELRPNPPERFSVLLFVLDVMITALIASVVAWILRIRNTWPASVAATVVALLLMSESGFHPPIPVRSFGFSYWIYWLVLFALMSALWTGYKLYPRRKLS